MRAHTGLCSLLVVVLSFGFVVGSVVELNDVFALDDESFDKFIKARELVSHFILFKKLFRLITCFFLTNPSYLDSIWLNPFIYFK